METILSLSCMTNVLETKSWSSTAGQPAVAQWEQHVHLEHVREVQSLYVLNISIFFFANFFLVCAINNKTSLKRAHWPRGTTRTTTTIESCWRAVSMYRHLAGEMPCKWMRVCIYPAIRATTLTPPTVICCHYLWLMTWYDSSFGLCNLGLDDSLLLATSGSSPFFPILFLNTPPLSLSFPFHIFIYFLYFILYSFLFLIICMFIIYISNLLRTFSFFHEPWTFFLWSDKHLSWHCKTNYLEQEITFCPEMELSYPKSRPNF